MSKRHSEQFKQEAVAYALSNKDKPVKAIATSIEIQSSTPEQFDKVIQQEVDKWGRIVKEAGIQPE